MDSPVKKARVPERADRRHVVDVRDAQRVIRLMREVPVVVRAAVEPWMAAR
jgi:hypothetical protein